MAKKGSYPIWYATMLDNAGLKQGEADARRIWQNMQRDAANAGSGVEKIWKKAGSAVGAYLSVRALGDFARQVVNVRGEMQGLGLAFETMLGSKAKADKMMADVVEFAMKTPFTVTDVASNVKQLIAMGAAGDDVMATFKSLGDAAAGLNVPISRLAINYGQVATLGKLQRREVHDFAIAGVPLLQTLADMMGKSVSEIQAMVTAGKIGFPEVQKAFAAMTGAGGKFNNMMEKSNSTVTGQLSRLQDQVEQMFNKIGAANEGVIYGAISGASSLVENYEKVGKILAELVATYGAYRAILISINAINATVATTQYAAEAASLYQLLSAEQKTAVSKKGLFATSAEYFALVKAETAANVRAAESALVKARIEVKAANQTVIARRAEYVVAKQLEQQRLAELMSIGATGTVKQVEVAQRRLNAAEAKRETAAIAWQSSVRDLNAKKTVVETAARSANTVASGVNTAAETANATATGVLITMKNQLTAATKRLTAAMLNNPWALAAAAVAAFAFGVYKLATYQTDAEKAQGRLNKAMGEADAAASTEIRALARLKGELSATEKGTDEYNKIKEKIVASYGKYHNGLAKEIEEVGLLDSTYQSLTKSIVASFGARQYETFMKSETDNLDKVMSKNLTKIQEELIDNLGDEAGSRVYSKVRNAVVAGTELDATTRAMLDKVQNKGELNAFGDIDLYMRNIRKALNLNKEIDALARNRFGIQDTSQFDRLHSMLGVPNGKNPTKIVPGRALTNEEKKQLEKQAEDLTKLRAQLADDAAQAEVDKMTEGAAKRRAQANLEYRQEVAAIKARLVELAKLNGGELSEQDSAQASGLLLAALTKNQGALAAINEDEKKAHEQSLEGFRSFAQEYERLFNDYQKKRADAVKAGADANGLAAADRAFEESISSLATQMQETTPEFAAWAQGIQQMVDGAMDDGTATVVDAAINQVQTMLRRAQTELIALQAGGIDSNEAERYAQALARIAKMQAELDKLQGKKTVKKSGRDWKDVYDVLKDVSDTFKDIGSDIGGTVGQIIGLAGNIVTTVISAINSIKTVSTAASQAVSNMEKASVILLIIQAAIQIITGIASAFKGVQQSSEVAAKAAKQFDDDMAEIQRNRRYDMFDTIFGVDYERKFKSAIKDFDYWTRGVEYFQKKYSKQLNDITATYDGRTLFGQRFGSDNIAYEHLNINDYINDDLTVDTEGLQAWLDAHRDALEDFEVQRIQAVIDAGKEQAAAEEVITEYIESLWGDLAVSISDNMIDAFLETGNAAENLGDIVDDVVRKMASSTISSMLIDDIFNDDLKDKLLGRLRLDDQVGANNLIKEAISKAEDLAPQLQGIMEAFGLVAGTAEAAARTSAAQGFAQASQDSIDHLSGIFTNIESHTFDISGNVAGIHGIMQANQKIAQANTDAILGHLSAIRTNTARLEAVENNLIGANRRLDNIADGIAALNR